MRGWILILATLAGCPAPAQTPAVPAGRPDVLVIISDDLNCRLGCYGDAMVRSPNLDRLAARGRRFERAFCQYPVCNPSRTSFLTGLRPETTRVFGNQTDWRPLLPGRTTLPAHFRRNGYRTASIGKVFHGDFIDPAAWDEFIPPDESTTRKPVIDGKSGYWYGRPVPFGEKGLGWGPTDRADAEEPDGIYARAAAEILRRPRDKPLFLAVGFHRPHDPFISPKKYFDLYDPARITLPATPAGSLAAVPAAALKSSLNHLEGFDDTLRKEFIRAYIAGISFMDVQLGVVLDALRESRREENTTVVFWGDHGYQLGEHGGLFGKATLFEETARVPMIFAGPGVKRAGEAAAGLAEFVDVYPTLCDLAGLPAPPGLEGASLRPLLADPSAPGKDAAYTMMTRGGVARSVRTARWRYTEWGGPGQAELYDHEADPGENRNLAKDPAQTGTVREMREVLMRVRR